MNTSDLDREARAKSVRNAVAITRMEGGQPSEHCLEQLALFEAGHHRHHPPQSAARAYPAAAPKLVGAS